MAAAAVLGVEPAAEMAMLAVMVTAVLRVLAAAGVVLVLVPMVVAMLIATVAGMVTPRLRETRVLQGPPPNLVELVRMRLDPAVDI